jgi:hypothetical protein
MQSCWFRMTSRLWRSRTPSPGLSSRRPMLFPACRRWPSSRPAQPVPSCRARRDFWTCGPARSRCSDSSRASPPRIPPAIACSWLAATGCGSSMLRAARRCSAGASAKRFASCSSVRAAASTSFCAAVRRVPARRAATSSSRWCLQGIDSPQGCSLTTPSIPRRPEAPIFGWSVSTSSAAASTSVTMPRSVAQNLDVYLTARDKRRLLPASTTHGS